MGKDFLEISINFIKILTILVSMIGLVPFLVWAERRVSALMQNRLGPNRCGPLGLMQTLADLVKPLMKEDFYKSEKKSLYYIAPILAVVPPAIVFGALPFSAPFEIPAFEWFGLGFGPYEFHFQAFHLNTAVVFALGISSLASYSMLVAGWSSNNRYSLLGALRAAAQNISYELALSLSLVGILLLFNSLDFLEIINKQSGPLSFEFLGQFFVFSALPNWGIFYQPLGALIFFVTLIAECNRVPFDLPEAEAELVAGYHTEYGGIKLILFYIGEYSHMMVSSALMVIFYFGGFNLYPFSHEKLVQALGSELSVSLLLFFVFLLKFFLFLFIFIWIRWSLPRFRYDQLMNLGWKKLLPWALFNAVLTGVFIYL